VTAGEGDIELPGGLRIPESELRFRFSRSAGPGGQHVNVTESRVELEWDVVASPTLSADQKARLRERLGRRIDSRGVLHLVSQQTRSQHRNRALVLERLVELVAAALRPARKRRPTAPSAAGRERRRSAKARRARLKRLRRHPSED
jgi:ribosome-associated protein